MQGIDSEQLRTPHGQRTSKISFTRTNTVQKIFAPAAAKAAPTTSAAMGPSGRTQQANTRRQQTQQQSSTRGPGNGNFHAKNTNGNNTRTASSDAGRGQSNNGRGRGRGRGGHGQYNTNRSNHWQKSNLNDVSHQRFSLPAKFWQKSVSFSNLTSHSRTCRPVLDAVVGSEVNSLQSGCFVLDGLAKVRSCRYAFCFGTPECLINACAARMTIFFNTTILQCYFADSQLLQSLLRNSRSCGRSPPYHAVHLVLRPVLRKCCRRAVGILASALSGRGSRTAELS